MDREVVVHVELEGTVHPVGRMWARVRKGRESATFEYDREWLDNPARFPLEPALQLGAGPQHTGADKAIFGAIGDSAPDRWGRVLMRRAERRRAKAEGRGVRTLFEADFLLLVDDETRLGALRFKETSDGPFLADHRANRVPPLVDLPKLLNAAERVLTEDDTDEDLRLLLAPGRRSGARDRRHPSEIVTAALPLQSSPANRTSWTRSDGKPSDSLSPGPPGYPSRTGGWRT